MKRKRFTSLVRSSTSRRLKPGTSAFVPFRRFVSRKRTKIFSKARNIGLKNVRTGGLLGLEVKYLDMALVNYSPTSPTDGSGAEADPTGTGCTGCLSAPAQGDTASSRDGFKIVAKSIQVEGVLSAAAQTDQTVADRSSSWYIALVLDTQTNGAQLNSEDVFVNVTGVGLASIAPLRNMSYTERFKVLKVKRLRAPPLAISYDGTNLEQQGFAIPFKMFVNLGALPIKFTAGSTTANVSGVVDNSIHLIVYASDTALNPLINYNARLRFVG